MQERRKRILKEARKIIAAGGVDALTTRKLAAAADVTQPTLYNLIGNKDKILEVLLSDLADRFEPPEEWYPETPMESLHALVEGTAYIYSNDDYFRMMYYLYWRIEDRSWANRSDASAKLILRRACEAAEKKRLLRGTISRNDLAESLYNAFFVPLMQWAVGALGPEEFKCQALKGMCLAMCADAMPRFCKQLHEEIARCDRSLNRLARASRKRASAS